MGIWFAQTDCQNEGMKLIIYVIIYVDTSLPVDTYFLIA